MPILYDVAIIGAGINGCAVAYELTCQDKKVVLFDKEDIASGGSGAAGAFISPKFSKAGELKELIHKAFLYSMTFYKTNFSPFIKTTKLVHIAKDEASSNILRHYKKHTSLKLQKLPFKTDKESISIDSAIVSAKGICKAMSSGTDFVKYEVKHITYENNIYNIDNKYFAKKVVLATGAYKQIIDEPYIKLRGIWGHRIDIKTTTKNDFSLHQFVSISPSDNGILAIGATHNVHYHPDNTSQIYDINDGRDELLQKAMKTIKLNDVEIIKDYTGLRSGSLDYIPIIGQIVNSYESLKLDKRELKTKKPNYDNYTYYKDLYMINGNGGYGFVLAPYLAQILVKNILYNIKIPNNLTPARFFARWVKKN